MPAQREIAEQCSQIVAQLKLQRAAGVSTLRPLRRVWSRHLRAAKGGKVLQLVQSLIDADVPRWFAYELGHHHRGAREQLTAARLRSLGRGLAAWDEVDPFAVYLLGPAWREGLVSDAELPTNVGRRASTRATHCWASGGACVLRASAEHVHSPSTNSGVVVAVCWIAGRF